MFVYFSTLMQGLPLGLLNSISVPLIWNLCQLFYNSRDLEGRGGVRGRHQRVEYYVQTRLAVIRYINLVSLNSYSFFLYTGFGTLIVATIYFQLIQNRYMFRSFTVLQCSHQHCVQPVASDVEVVGYL